MSEQQQNPKLAMFDQIEVTEHGFIVKMPKSQENRFKPEDFVRPAKNIEVEPAWYVATDEDGAAVGVVSVNETDRRVVAAIVGNWIADGLPVTRVNYKGLMRALRAAAPKTEPAPAKTGSEPTGSEPEAQQTGGEPAGTNAEVQPAPADAQ